MKKSTLYTLLSVLIGAGVIGAFAWFVTERPPEQTGAPADPLQIAPDDHITGSKDASVTLVEYLDFECSACGAYFPVVKKLEQEFPQDLRIVKRYFPLPPPNHSNGLPSALAVEAAARQGKYAEMHDLLFTEQKSWGGKPADKQIFERYAEKLGLDMDRFKEDVSSAAVKTRVNRDKNSGTTLGISGTPTFFLNGEKLQNPGNYEAFKALIQKKIVKAPQAEAPVAQENQEKIHEHADFAIYLEGEKMDFQDPKYQSSEEKALDPDTHLHDGVGDVIHKHKKGITLGYFLGTLGLRLDGKCLTTEAGKEYCDTADKPLRLYVNGTPNDTLGNYEFSDLDRLLITYGKVEEAALKQELESIGDRACIYSEKCPERGAPPTESCAGGLGTSC